jgi:Ca2+-binding EF-hand superfamily protein
MDAQAIDKILDTIKTRRFTTLKEITRQTGIKEPRIRLIIAFLEKFQFIDVDKDGNIKLNALIKQFLAKLEKTDPKSSYEEITA